MSSSEYRFTPTQDWFSGQIPTWTSLFPFVKSSDPKILEIGSWEGRSAVFLLTPPLCALGGSIVCIDHFDLSRTAAGTERRAKVDHNLALTNKAFRVLDDFSVPSLMVLLKEAMEPDNSGFDWIYIDGSHEAEDTFLDAELAWRLAKKDAVFIFDDYLWNKEPQNSPHHPRRGIDAFMQLHHGDFNVLVSGYQMILQKTTEMRIGFLTKEIEVQRPHIDEAFEYGINIALTIDSSYAMPAAVMIRSVVENTDRRITFYIVGCGLQDEDADDIRESIPERRNVTINFIPLPANSVAERLGPRWAKLDIVNALPVERALYLDADTLVRGDLKDLWETDLDGKMIGAVQDVGFPFGHDGIERAPYFNAGVLLMDLAQIRGEIATLMDLASMMETSKYRDQDVLNVHFRGTWVPLSLKWNAQGLGTYANSPSTDRDRLPLGDMDDAKVVHFTGPVSPSLQQVLDPYIQPCACKPWGYLGAPGHPYAAEWMMVLEKTVWSHARDGEKWVERMKNVWKLEIEKVKEAAIKEFNDVVATTPGRS
jgi:lipopolysaccharide biosynthesis glycosyltransferase